METKIEVQLMFFSDTVQIYIKDNKKKQGITTSRMNTCG